MGVDTPLEGDELPDGLSALRAELKLSEIMRLIERTARWVDPATFKLLPLWYPEYARRTYMYKSNWSEPLNNTDRKTKISRHKHEGNGHANKALTRALGLRSDDRPNWSCCHLWGVDDASYQIANAIVQDRRFYSCIANMVLLPSPLKAFTDVMPEVKAMLRICALHLYEWHCEHEAVSNAITTINQWADWNDYPESWPRVGRQSSPLGLVPLSAGIRRSAESRIARIRRDMNEAGKFYPRKEVREALAYWKIAV